MLRKLVCFCYGMALLVGSAGAADRWNILDRSGRVQQTVTGSKGRYVMTDRAGRITDRVVVRGNTIRIYDRQGRPK